MHLTSNWPFCDVKLSHQSLHTSVTGNTMSHFNKISVVYFVIYFATAVVCDANTSSCQEDNVNGSACSAKQKFICYFTNFSTNRTETAKFNVSDIPTTTPCTHIIYSFAVLNPKTLTMEMSMPNVDPELYRQVTALKSQGLKVSLALGGWLDSENGDKYSKMINNGFARTNFVHDTVKFLQKHHFDGLDLDWEYPRCHWGNCTSGPASDVNNFANLVQELKIAFKFYGLLVSVAVSGDVVIASQSYDIHRIGVSADWIGLMTYDLHSSTSNKTGHHSPYMGNHPNSVDSISLWTSHGVPASKLVMGIPLYGRSLTLADVTMFGVGAPAFSLGKPGLYTKEAGFLAYFEFCPGQKGWLYKDVAGVGSYAVKDDQWVSFNDVGIIGEKMKHVLQYKLGGIMLWALDLDDFNGQFCNEGSYPLITAMKNALILNSTNIK